MAVDLGTQVFTHHLVYRRTGRWLDLGAAARAGAAEEVQGVLDRYAGTVDVRGVYSAAGLRPDADVILWVYGNRAEAIQDLAVDLRRTTFGLGMELSWAFWGLVRPPETAGERLTALQKGEAPLQWLCLYPFVRTPEWYLIPAADRGQMLRQHGLLGREFPGVYTNNALAFGLGDYEWVLAFESDRPEDFVDMVRRLRDAGARRYAKEETPFILGRRKPVSGAIADLG